MAGGPILDATGTAGRGARVDEENRLFVLANTVTHIQHHSITHQNLFSLTFCLTIGTANEFRPFALFKNIDSEKYFEFYITQVTSNSDLEIEGRIGDDYGSGGDKVTPINLFLGSGTSLAENVATVYQGGSGDDLVLSGGDYWQTVFIGERRGYEINFSGGLIIPNGQSISLYAKGETVGKKVCVLALCSWHATGVIL